MVAVIDLLDVQQQAANGGYGGLRQLSDDTVAALMDAIVFWGELYRWRVGGDDLDTQGRDIVDALIGQMAQELIEPVKVVIGELKFITFANPADAPDNWLQCTGGQVPKSQYPELGNVPDVGEFAANWVMPNYQGCNTRVRRNTDPLTGYVGADTHSLTAAQNGPHIHTERIRPLIAIPVEPGPLVTVAGPSSAALNTARSGSGEPHNNIPFSFLTDVWMVARQP